MQSSEKERGDWQLRDSLFIAIPSHKGCFLALFCPPCFAFVLRRRALQCEDIHAVVSM